MKPTEKTPELDAVIKDIFGIDRRASIEANTCVFCKAPLKDFRNAISEREAAISGLCQKCQDKTFGYDEPDPPLPPEPKRQFYTPTDNDYVVQRMPMICGSAEAESRRYHKYVGKSGKVWLVADQEDAAANVYVAANPEELEPGYRGFQGFGGGTLTFPLVEGGEIKLKGPWHANAFSLFSDTGVDVRDKHRTFVVISRRRQLGEHYESIMVDVLYKDDEPQIGSFHRGDILARQWAREIGAPVFCFSQSAGGSSNGQVKPDQVFYWEKDAKVFTETTASQDAIIRS